MHALVHAMVSAAMAIAHGYPVLSGAGAMFIRTFSINGSAVHMVLKPQKSTHAKGQGFKLYAVEQGIQLVHMMCIFDR